MSWVSPWNCLAVSALAMTTLASAEARPAPADSAISADDAQTPPAAHRHGRFALVEMQPSTGERDLLQQVVETAVPNALHATVGDGLRHLLARSGYRLCDATEAATLYALPLPAAHLHLGPLTLRDALKTVSGSAWSLSVDEVSRIVCFARSAPSVEPMPRGTTDKHGVRQP